MSGPNPQPQNNQGPASDDDGKSSDPQYDLDTFDIPTSEVSEAYREPRKKDD